MDYNSRRLWSPHFTFKKEEIMKSLQKFLLVGILSMLILGAGESEQDPAIGWNTPSPKLAFKDSYTLAGISLARIEFEIYTTADVLVAEISAEDANGITPELRGFVLPIYADLEALPNEAIYWAQGRVIDTDGNTSEWSPKFWFSKNWRTLPPPTGCVLLRN